ncbi:MAG: hypothetical protein AAGI23_08770 [Bacteroidota bacterium]
MNTIQYLTNPQGVRTSVVISIEDWKRLFEYVDELKRLQEIGVAAREGLAEAKELEKQPKKTKEEYDQALNDFLDEL